MGRGNFPSDPGCLLVSPLAGGAPLDLCVVPWVGARAHRCLGSPKDQPLPGNLLCTCLVGSFCFFLGTGVWDCTYGEFISAVRCNGVESCNEEALLCW